MYIRKKKTPTAVLKILFFFLSQIKLYTKQGSLKYQTDCAPINGYFMIPIYDKVWSFFFC